MYKPVWAIVFLCVFPIIAWGGETTGNFENHWPQWRGPHANGVSPHGTPPVTWSESENIKWKVEIRGKGHATPIIWGDLVFISTAVETDKQVRNQNAGAEQGERRGPPITSTSNIHNFAVLAINRSDGKIVWQRTAREELPHEGIHPTGTWASNSPVTDGEHVYVYFGSRGLYCYDLKGNLKWEKDLGDMAIKLSFGEGSSPVLHGDKLVVNWDHEGESFIIALDKKTGEEIWKVSRDESTSWATPLIVESAGKTQVVTSATRRIRSYDLANGELLWESTGMTANVIPSPVTSDGMLYVMSGFRGNALQAIRLADAKGDLASTGAIVWTLDKDTPYTPSPLLYESKLYFLKSNDGILACFDARTGEPHFSRKRLEGIEGVYASPVGANGRVYIASRNGMTQVIKHGTEYELLATNKLDDSFSASPAVAGNQLYLRGEQNLYCIAEK
jgi:outer membrane protein assembly factor BamB